MPAEERISYQAVRHQNGDLVQVRDCVLVRSGPRKTDTPYVAKIASLWERPSSGNNLLLAYVAFRTLLLRESSLEWDRVCFMTKGM